jgi:hypothetical protein
MFWWRAFCVLWLASSYRRVIKTGQDQHEVIVGVRDIHTEGGSTLIEHDGSLAVGEDASTEASSVDSNAAPYLETRHRVPGGAGLHRFESDLMNMFLAGDWQFEPAVQGMTWIRIGSNKFTAVAGMPGPPRYQDDESATAAAISPEWLDSYKGEVQQLAFQPKIIVQAKPDQRCGGATSCNCINSEGVWKGCGTPLDEEIYTMSWPGEGEEQYTLQEVREEKVSGLSPKGPVNARVLKWVGSAGSSLTFRRKLSKSDYASRVFSKLGSMFSGGGGANTDHGGP